jgi:hypothetical protein
VAGRLGGGWAAEGPDPLVVGPRAGVECGSITCPVALSWDGDPLSLPFLLAMQGVLALARRPLRWKVGVVRAPSPSSWKTDRIRVIHKERLAEGEEPSRRIAELVTDVNAGAFDPA